jgi:hypothetical protein
MPLADDGDDDDDDGCASDTPQPVEHIATSTAAAVHVPDSPSAGILAPYQHLPTPHPSPSQYPHATLPVSPQAQTPAILGTIIGIVIALVAFSLTTRYVVRRRRIVADPFKDSAKPRFIAFRLRPRSTRSKKRLSDESWVSPLLPALGSPGSPLSQDLELRRYAFPKRRLVPVTTPVCTPTDTEFGSRLECANGDPGSVIPAPHVRLPSPVYFSPFSPSPSLSSSSSSLSPAPSTEPLSSPSANTVRLSRLLSSTFRDTRVVVSPARPTTAHLIHTARSYAHAYRPSSATTTSLYTPPTSSARLAGTRSRTSFYPGPTDEARAGWGRVRDTFSTVTTSDTDTVCTVPHLLRAVAEAQPSTSPFADPDPGTGTWYVSGNEQSASASPLRRLTSTEGQTPVGTSLASKLRLSDASEHAQYRLRERERERKRQRERERERTEQRLSTDSRASGATATSVETVRAIHRRSRSLEMEEARKEFRLRDSERVLREIGW